MSIETMKLALEALEINLIFLKNVKPFKGQEDLASDCVAMTEETIFALEEALAKQEQGEPVKLVAYNCTCGKTMKFESEHGIVAQQRTWVGLTDEEMRQVCYEIFSYDPYAIARVIEAKLKEKNT